MNDRAGKGTGTGATREERLAAKLRENLHRRKAQARAQQAPVSGEPTDGLSKPPPQS